MNARSLIKGVSIVAAALVIAVGGVGMVFPETGLAHVAAQGAASATFTVGQSVVVNADALNMRADASIEAEIVTTLQKGTWATVVAGPVSGDDYSWYQVEYDDFTGWVAADYLVDAATGGVLAQGAIVIVNTESLNLRSDAGSSSEVILILEGAAVGSVVSGPESADDMDWYEIDFDGTQGWVSRTYLAIPATGDDATAVADGVLSTATAVAAGDAI